MKKSIILLFTIVALSACKKEKTQSNTLGLVDLEVTGNEEAAKHFEKGLLLLHSFEYDDAQEAFDLAQQADPQMAANAKIHGCSSYRLEYKPNR